MKKPLEKKSKKQTEKSTETKTTERPFDVWAFVNDISYNKRYLYDEETSSAYNSWTINKAFSFYIDTVYDASYMNQYHRLPKKVQHDFLINSIRPKKRYEKWVKQDKDSEEAKDIAAIQEYYHYSLSKARAALSILTKEQIAIIKTKIDRGGIAK